MTAHNLKLTYFKKSNLIVVHTGACYGYCEWLMGPFLLCYVFLDTLINNDPFYGGPTDYY